MIKKLIIYLLISVNIFLPSVAFANLNTSNIAYYKLDESSGNAADATGSGNTLTNTNSVSFVPALINNGADFGTANTNKCFLLNASMGYSGGSGAGSISFWVKSRTAPGTNVLYTLVNMSGGTNPSNTRMLVRYSDVSGTKQLQFIRQSSSFSQQATFNTTLSTSAFTHVVMTYDGTTILGYVNGVQQASGASAGNAGTDPPQQGIAANPADCTAQPSSVYIDEVGFWNRLLTSGEVTTLYNAGAGCAYQSSSWTSCGGGGVAAASALFWIEQWLKL